MSIKIKTQLGLIIFLVVFALSLVLSQKANPSNSSLFSLKRVQEKVYLKLKSDPGVRVDYMIFLLNNRLYELDTVVKGKNYQFVLPSASRYSTLAGQITDLVITNNLKSKVESIKQTFENHQKVLNDLYVYYPKNIPDNVEWKYIQDDVNYLKIYLDKLSKI